MPWTPQDAYRHTKKASSPKLQRMWAAIANSELERTGDDALAIKAANSRVGAMKRSPKRKKAA